MIRATSFVVLAQPYRGTSLIRKRPLLGPYRRPLPRRPRRLLGGWAFSYGRGAPVSIRGERMHGGRIVINEGRFLSWCRPVLKVLLTRTLICCISTRITRFELCTGSFWGKNLLEFLQFRLACDPGPVHPSCPTHNTASALVELPRCAVLATQSGHLVPPIRGAPPFPNKNPFGLSRSVRFFKLPPKAVTGT